MNAAEVVGTTELEDSLDGWRKEEKREGVEEDGSKDFHRFNHYVMVFQNVLVEFEEGTIARFMA